jgi:hypothetical protein
VTIVQIGTKAWLAHCSEFIYLLTLNEIQNEDGF